MSKKKSKIARKLIEWAWSGQRDRLFYHLKMVEETRKAIKKLEKKWESLS